MLIQLAAVCGLDGGDIAYFSVLQDNRKKYAETMLKVSSLLCVVLIIILGAYLLCITGGNSTMLLAGIYLIFPFHLLKFKLKVFVFLHYNGNILCETRKVVFMTDERFEQLLFIGSKSPADIPAVRSAALLKINQRSTYVFAFFVFPMFTKSECHILV